MNDDPRLRFEYSWPLILAEQVGAAESNLALAEHGARDTPTLLGQVAAAQAYVARIRGDGRRAVELSQRALSLLPPDDWVTRSVVGMNLGMATWYAGQLAGTERVLAEAQDAAERSGNEYAGATARVFLCKVQAARGRLRHAAEMYRQAIQWGGQLPIVSLALTDLAMLLYEWDDLESAATHAQQAIELSQRTGNVELQLAGHRTLALILEAQGDSHMARQALQQSSQLAQHRGISAVARLHALAYHTLVALSAGDLGLASPFVRQFPDLQAVESLPAHLILGQALARWLLAQDRRAEAADLLNACYGMASRAGLLAALIQTRALQALAAPTRRESSCLLAEALNLAEPEGYIRTFLDLGEPTMAQLRCAAMQGTATGYAARLLARSARKTTVTAPQPASMLHRSPLIEPLSDRESEVLSLLADGLSNEEIARVLFLAVNTVKTHLKSIYGKLGVHGRREAVGKATELGLLA